MKLILNLIWSGHKDPVVTKALPLTLADAGADFLLRRSEGKKHPTHILPEYAGKYGIDVSVEDVKDEAKVSRKGNIKAEPVTETETFEDPFKLEAEEIPVPFTGPEAKDETEPKPKKGKKPVVKSKEDLEAGK